MLKKNAIIMGAAGRDFHNFNVLFRNNSQYNIIAFTATQIPDIEDRRYPSELSGVNYPNGIPIYSEDNLNELIAKDDIDEVIFAYSDVPHEYVMHKASQVIACGANFCLLGANKTMLRSKLPVISICATRTGCGKSQTTRKICSILKEHNKKLAVIRHPMPYGNLSEQRVQRFGTLDDLIKHKCTIEEREEYEPHIIAGNIVYAGVDYGDILEQAEKEADIIIWDGGNNDLPFYRPDLHIVVTDPHRTSHELTYHPGEANLLMANAVIINKIDTADLEDIEELRYNIRFVNPKAKIVDAASPLFVDDPEVIFDKKVLVVEDGPTLTHGEMTFGAGTIAAQRWGAREIIDPREYTVGSISETFKKYPEIGALLPAMGYGESQIRDLEKTINKVPCDLVIIGTPIDLRKLIEINKPCVRIWYELQEIGKPDLKDILRSFF